MMIHHLLRSTIRRGKWQHAAASVRWETSDTGKKTTLYENAYGPPIPPKTITNQNISYAKVCELQTKFGAIMERQRVLMNRRNMHEVDENIKIMAPMAESIQNYFDFQEPRTPAEAVKATMTADKLLRKKFEDRFSKKLPAWEKIEMDEDDFSYVMDHYGESGTFLDLRIFNPPVSKEEVLASYRLYYVQHQMEEWADPDSDKDSDSDMYHPAIDTFGCEDMRNLMLLARRRAPIEHLPGAPASIQRASSIIFPE